MKHKDLSVRVPIELDNPSILRIEDKCISCGLCKNVCQNDIGVLGTYTLKETIAPDGYAISEEITFIAGESKKVIMKDDPTKVIIKKLDTVTNKRVVGAGLQLLDENKKVLAEWQTTDEDFVITKLSVGKQYFVKEVKTPDNYLETEVVPFTLQANQNNIEVVINNTPIVYVPNTADNVNIITIVVGAIVVLGGIGTIIWIRKRSA